ncbi:hypothetical protein H310_11948 [Aphanomyces invadans]|uniref:Protein SMG9 n=1 Tax=Aphanomyces invadans TaxID=157072 RepID=A0A024TLR6_9STRA|nr:hypothetical protein H310_11948 [Aphanomyces invadans]ETV94292.1 hypothetical protein H310_11948 [Aphanomyces invadans]|eukprot:XP_008877054.1 hypothetical protein H310_11948 [Aphanomyces invadans]
MDDNPTPKPRRGNGAATSKGKPKGGRGGTNASGTNTRGVPVAAVAPTILRPQVSTTIFTPDMPRQQLLFTSSATPQKLFNPKEDPASPPAPMLPRSSQPGNRGKASPTIPSMDRLSMRSTSLFVAPGPNESTATSFDRWKLVTPQMQHCAVDSVPVRCRDMTQFVVVGCVGLEGVGKSTIMSILNGHDPFGNTPSASLDTTFPIQSHDTVLHGCHETTGIDVCVTSDNVILLDSQPLLSTSMLVDMVSQHDSPKFGALALDHQIQLTSLHILTYLLSVCHHLIVVHDHLDEPDLWQLLHLAQLIKSRQAAADATSASTNSPSVAKLIFLANKMSPLAPSQLARHSLHLHQLFAQTSSSTSTAPATCATIVEGGGSISVMTMPSLTTGAPSNKDAATDAINTLRSNVAQLPRVHPTTATDLPPTATFFDWVQYSSRQFEAIRQPMVDYARLLHKIASSK